MTEAILVFHDTRENDYPAHSGFFIVKFPDYRGKENGFDILYWQHIAKKFKKFSCKDFLWAELPELGE